MAGLTNSGNNNSSSGGDNQLGNSPFGRLKEVLTPEEFSKLFSGVGNGQNSGSPFGGGNNGDGNNLPYNGNPFAGDNFWDIFAGGVNPSAGNGGRDPLTGAGSQSTNSINISTTKIPDGLSLKANIDSLVNSRLKEELGDGKIPSFGGGQSPSGGGQNPFGGGSQNPSGGGQNPFGGGQNPFGGGQNPFGGGSQNPSGGG
ncbi:MAG: hypothetical protein RMX59_033925, partial [Nostoc sp. DedSLP05]